MSFLRPELRAAALRWREVIAAAALAGLGLWWGVGSRGILGWLGWALVLIGAAAAYAAVQRLRFDRGGGGEGVVQIRERRLAYFGPVTGGILDLDDLVQLAIDRRDPPARWVLTPAQGAALVIPVDATGASGLIDAFAALPGLGAERLIAALARDAATVEPLWQADPARATALPRGD